jgi:c-di-GMP-binding flagellar brake protein YcgR
MLLCEYTEGMELALTIKDDVKEGEKLADARTKDISVAGVSLVTKRECTLGEKYFLKLYINGPKDRSPPFLVCGEVRRSIFTFESGIYDVGMGFLSMAKSKKEFLNRYILTTQQKMIVQKKLIEGE